ncbi:hypothetical protein [Mangrovibacterium lignilyticum]|uniref:hypothetical protein n=1 Tax=Mangrovibacterium lignilyticum TaxID=2668052 RepID=UPI0013D85E73|nr:hypothetical protein [Mangrovibacterium lignilyticum]
MDRNKLLHIIQKNLAELSEINQELSQNNQLSKFEIELALNKSKLIFQEYEFLLEIYQRGENVVETPAQIEVKQAVVEEVTQPKPKETEQAETPVIENSPAPIQLEETVEEETAAAIIETDVNEDPVEVEIPKPEPIAQKTPNREEPVAQPEEVVMATTPITPPREKAPLKTSSTNGHSEKRTLVDQFQSRSLNDLLTSTGKLDQRLASSPIQKLENAIGLNDRFQYIRELFQNDSDKFRETVGKIDKLHTLEDAISYLDGQFNWKESETSLQFLHLVKRRFSN